jgi:hypothetical protein
VWVCGLWVVCLVVGLFVRVCICACLSTVFVGRGAELRPPPPPPVSPSSRAGPPALVCTAPVLPSSAPAVVAPVAGGGSFGSASALSAVPGSLGSVTAQGLPQGLQLGPSPPLAAPPPAVGLPSAAAAAATLSAAATAGAGRAGVLAPRPPAVAAAHPPAVAVAVAKAAPAAAAGGTVPVAAVAAMASPGAAAAAVASTSAAPVVSPSGVAAAAAPRMVPPSQVPSVPRARPRPGACVVHVGACVSGCWAAPVQCAHPQSGRLCIARRCLCVGLQPECELVLTRNTCVSVFLAPRPLVGSGCSPLPPPTQCPSIPIEPVSPCVRMCVARAPRPLLPSQAPTAATSLLVRGTPGAAAAAAPLPAPPRGLVGVPAGPQAPTAPSALSPPAQHVFNIMDRRCARGNEGRAGSS